GLGVTSRRFTRFGIVLADFDNDGDLDMYQGNGRIDHSPEFDGVDPFAEPNVLYRRNGGIFEVVSPEGGTSEILAHTSRGVAMGDVDNDGGIDLVVVNKDAPAYLLMNRLGESGNWMRFRVVNRHGSDAIGATVWATVGEERRRRDVQTATSYLASHDPKVHFGVGQARSVADVEVQWPTGETEGFGDFDAGEPVELRYGAGRRL
ncbi:MAG: CRTAC1 family protein, partial [Gammaproteobacteria bacterium]|nr:CRTAC1 family protein [Gammaproteobacteria bacterium]